MMVTNVTQLPSKKDYEVVLLRRTTHRKGYEVVLSIQIIPQKDYEGSTFVALLPSEGVEVVLSIKKYSPQKDYEVVLLRRTFHDPSVGPKSKMFGKFYFRKKLSPIP